MLILVNGCTRTMRRLASVWRGRLGVLLSPAAGNTLSLSKEYKLPWALDNGAYSGFDARAFAWALWRVRNEPRCLFAVAPDVVCDARKTLERFGQWAARIRASGLPVALVGQNGAEAMELPWSDFSAFFVGGDTDWKLSDAAASLVGEAKRRGKWVHMGRVNSGKRLRYAVSIGCDSVDGTATSMFGDAYIEAFCQQASQMGLWSNERVLRHRH